MLTNENSRNSNDDDADEKHISDHEDEEEDGEEIAAEEGSRNGNVKQLSSQTTMATGSGGQDDGGEIDDESQSSSGSNAGSQSDSSGDDGDDDDDEANGLSAYERLRQERIKRNNLLLKELGLAGQDGGGVLGKKKSQTRNRRNSAPKSSGSAAPSRRSRRSTGQNVSYVEPSLRAVLGGDQKVGHNPPPSLIGDENVENPANGNAVIDVAEKKPKRGRPPKSDRSQRMARFVYDEFSRVKQHQKQVLKEAGKNLKGAETEFKWWQKKALVREKREQRKMEAEAILKQQKEEYALYGSSLRSFVHSLERRTFEITAKMNQFDATRLVRRTRSRLKHLCSVLLSPRNRPQTAEQQVEMEARRLENENRLKLLEALDAYPKAMKVSVVPEVFALVYRP